MTTSRLDVQVPGVSMTRFFVPSLGVTHQWTVKEMASRDDFVFLDMSATYQTIGSQVARSCGLELLTAPITWGLVMTNLPARWPSISSI